MQNCFDFTGQKILVTGATGGIGLAISKAFLQAGASVVGTSTSTEKAESIKQDLHQYKEKFHTITCNLSSTEETSNLIKKASEAMEGLDVLICNAGLTKDKLAISMSIEDWTTVTKVNLDANFILNRDAAKLMMKKKYGRIVNITSVVGITGNAGQANYAASKAGLIGLTKTMALEFAKRNITVNAVAPGFIATPMTDALSEEIKQKIIEKIPVSRYGTSEEIAAAVLFLSSKYSGYITGEILNVNGGMVMC